MAATVKVWKASRSAPCGIQISEEYSSLVGNSEHFFLADNKGCVIHGPTSIVATAESRRVGGLFVGINDFLHMIPSTIMTPIPQHVPIPPIFALAHLANDAAFFMAYLA